MTTLLQELHRMIDRFNPEKIANEVFNSEYVQKQLFATAKETHGNRADQIEYILDRMSHLVAGKHDISAIQFMSVMDELHDMVEEHL